MSKLSKLIQKPDLFFIDGYKNIKLSFFEITNRLNKYAKEVDSEKFNQLLLYSITSLTFLTFSYFYLIGRSKYVVSSAVIVRKTSENQTPGLSISNLIGGGNLQSLEDAKYLEVYIKSPQVLKEFEKQFDFKETFRKKGLDIFSGVKPFSNREKRYKYFVKQIKINLNPNSGVLEIKNYAFKPEDALEINQFLLKQSETFVNKLNQEIFKRQLDFGDKQIKKAKKKLDNEVKKLQSFQSNFRMLNIESESNSTLNMIAGLENKLVELQIKLSDAERVFVEENSPEIEYLTNQVNILKAQIEKERNKLVSDEGKALNKRSAEINEIKSNISFLKEIYKTTLSTSERNKVDSSQQQRFLAVLSQPFKPEDEWNYWRHKGFLTYLSLLVITYSLFKFILGIADNHRD